MKIIPEFLKINEKDTNLSAKLKAVTIFILFIVISPILFLIVSISAAIYAIIEQATDIIDGFKYAWSYKP